MISPRAKHERMQGAIRKAIANGVLKAGDQLPPEQDLADGVGLSLGTVRRCLTSLARVGVVSREHGRGTFVAGMTVTENEVWHFRFLGNDLKTVRPVYQRVIERKQISTPGPWADVLGESRTGYIHISRAVNVDSLFVCHSDFFLSADRFSGLLDMSARELETTGVKHVMALRFNVPIIETRKVLQTLPAPVDISDNIGIKAGRPAQCLKIVGHSIEALPVSYQEIWIPPTEIPLDITNTTHRTGSSH